MDRMPALLALLVASCAAKTNTTSRHGGRRLHGPAEALRSFHAQDVASWVRDRAASSAEAMEKFALEVALAKAKAAPCGDAVAAGACVHQNNGVPCAPLPPDCARPCAALSVKLYGAAGATQREGVLMHLWGSSEAPRGGAGRHAPKGPARTAQLEGGAFHDRQWRDKALDYARRGAWFVTALREPLDRVWSRYWYEGRYGAKGAVRSESEWLDRSACYGRGLGNRCLDNYYVRTFSGRAYSERDPRCAGETDDCNGGVSRDDLEAAKIFLETAFDDVLVSEWLSHPGTFERLATPLCYDPDARRPFPRSKRPNARAADDSILQPSFLAKRAPGGRSDERPPGWAPPADAQERLRRANRWDLELYAWAADRERAKLAGTAAAAKDGLPEPGVLWARDFELF